MDNLTRIVKTEISRQYKSVRQFAFAVNIPLSTINSALHNGIGGSSFDTVVQICQTLGIKAISSDASFYLTEDTQQLLDQYAQNRDLFAEYYRRYRELVTVKRQLDALNASESDKQRRIEALTAEIDTIDAAALQPGEEKTLQERKNVITHAQSILAGITAAHLALAGDEDGEQAGAADLLGGAVDGLQNSARLDESLTAMSERLNDLYYSARELATDLADRLDAYGFDAGELDQIETRLDTIYRIKQKFGMEVDELLARREVAAAELETFQSSGQKIAELKAQMPPPRRLPRS